MKGRTFPIEFWPVTLTPTNSGGKTEQYLEDNVIKDFAEVRDGSEGRANDSKGLGQQRSKRFKVDYRPSLESVINQKTQIKFDGSFYTIVTIAKEKNKRFHFLIEAMAKV